MASILQRTSRSRSAKITDGKQISPESSPASTIPFEIASSMVHNEALSRGVHLLLKGKQFHLARRGLQETSGFWYISNQPKRNARSIAAAKLHQWELESEQAPADELCFWKLTEEGGVHAVTVPDALFASNANGQSSAAEGQQYQQLADDVEIKVFRNRRQQEISQVGGFKGETIVPPAQSSASRGTKQQLQQQQQLQQHQRQEQQQRIQRQFGGGARGIGSDEAKSRNQTHMTSSGVRGSVAPFLSSLSSSSQAAADRRVRQDVDREIPGACSRSSITSTALLDKELPPRKVDRFGRKIKIARKSTDRHAVKTLEGPPEGTLTALGWGWGGEFRIGTGRDGFETWPRPLHPDCKRKQLVDIAEGKRHTLFVSDDGLVFSVGEGLSWQLGTTSQFINRPERQAVQRLPKKVHPSGDLKAGKDYWVAQAAAGDTFSVTREANWEDAARATEGFLWMKASVKLLLEQSPSSEALKELWAHMLEEERTLQRRFQGRLLSWGSGKRGQLGLGEGAVDRRTPRVIRALSGLPVRSVVAGAAHTLCVTLDGKVFSWGRGQDGRLGHGDYKDRWEPCRVRGLGPDPVALIGAGKAHSMAVSLPRSVHVWGRGEHGRLGTGDNKCRHEPVRLKTWPPGFPACVVKDVALGGAHTIVLAHRRASTTLANPWGAESLAYAWGYGYCGQLGLGRRVGEIKTPSKVAFDMKELITSVVAGKAFSLAANVQGQMFVWGKGWTGQLGLGITKDTRVAPTRVDFPGVGRHLIVKMAAGERHASALTLGCYPPPRGWDKDKQWEKVIGSHVGMKKWESGLLRVWRCPRRPPWTKRGPNPEPLYECATCGISCVCRTCARSCHRGHDIRQCTRQLRVLCECGLGPFGSGSDSSSTSGRCGGSVDSTHSFPRATVNDRLVGLKGKKVKPGASHGLHDIVPGAAAEAPRCRLLALVEDEDDGGDTARWLHRNAVECQRLVRGWLGRGLARRRGEEKRRRRREAMEAVWYVTVLGAIEKSIARFEKNEEWERNREGMAAADLESAFYRYYRKLQPAIMALNQQRQVLKDTSTREGVTLETHASASNPRVNRGLAPRETVTVWSRRAVRQLQRQFPPNMRLSEKEVVLMTARLPAGGDRPKRSPEKGGVGNSGGSSAGARDAGVGGGARGYCGEADGAGRLGGVADPDVDALLRSCQLLKPQRTVDVAGPERLYQRVTRMRASQLQRLSSRRRASFSEGDFAARVDKTVSTEDVRWSQKLGRYWMGVDRSLGATRYLQIGDRKCNKLTDTQQLRWRRGARALHKFLRNFGPGSVDPDVAAVKDRERTGRSHSLCAPERVYAATVTWESRHRKLQTLLRAAAKRGYPASGDGMKWTRRAERWGGLAPLPRATAIPIDSLRKSAQRIVTRAAKRGWDLRPSTSQSRTGSGHNKLAGDLTATPGAPEAAAAGPWSAHKDQDGNTYYVNDSTGESSWELPPPTAATADAVPGSDVGNQASGGMAGTVPSSIMISAAAGEGEVAAWWSADGGSHGGSPVIAGSNPFDGYEWPAEEKWAGVPSGASWGGGYGQGAGRTGWESATQEAKGGGAEGWNQVWDEGSRSYYWYNSLTGESQW